MSYDKSKERYPAQMLYYVNKNQSPISPRVFNEGWILYYTWHLNLLLTKTRLVPYLCLSDFRALYLAFNARSGIHISCAHYKYHNEERSRLKKAYEILLESVAMPL